MGNAWSVLPRVLREWALPLQVAVISVEYGLAPQAQYLAPVEDCWPDSSGQPTTRPDSASTRTASWWQGRAPAVDSPPPSPC